jgi:hypothetical protein
MEFPHGSNKPRANGQKPSKVAPTLSIWGSKAATNALDWSAVDARLVTAALSAVSSADGALMVGVAQGGRGVVLTLFLGGQRAKTYLGSVEELEGALYECVDTLSSSAEDLRQVFGLPPG